MVDIAVKNGAAWVCQAEGHRLADVLSPVQIGDKDDHEDELKNWWGCQELTVKVATWKR